LTEPLIMGIVNCTPDSFFDGGLLMSSKAGIAHGLTLARQGARILDVGGESTRPGAKPVSEAQERERVLPVLSGLARERELGNMHSLLSVDTYKSGVAVAALASGAEIINDISACRFDPGLMDVLTQFKPGYVLMHSLGQPETMQIAPRYKNVVDEILAFFQQRLDLLVAAGFSEEYIVLDPGIGFGKLLEHNIAILRGVDRFLTLGRPVLIGVSNKSLWQGLLGLELTERTVATQVATALLAAAGVALHRVHDVENTSRTLRIVQTLTASRARP
jgi:dihydropteroate synthase